MLRPRAKAVNTTATSAAELDRALELMYFGHRKLVEEPDRLLARRGLARMHHRILYFVVRRPQLTMGELLGELGVTKQAVHQPIRDLIARRLVIVIPDPADRRIRRLSVSGAGGRFEGELTGIQHRRLTRVFAGAGRRAELGWRNVMTKLAGRNGPAHED